MPDQPATTTTPAKHSTTTAAWRPILGWGCFAAIVVGVLLRLTVRDRFRTPAMAFYMLSPASMTLLAGAGWLLFRSATRQWLTAALALSALCCGTWTYGSMFHSNSHQLKSENGIRLLFWNVCRGRLGWEGIVETVNAEAPDVMVLAEIENLPNEDQFFSSNFPDHSHIVKLPRGVYVLSTFSLGDSVKHHQSWRGLFQSVQIQTDNGDISLLIADLPSPPHYKREEPIGLLTDMAMKFLDRPAVIVGDMNTPVDSVFLNQLRARYTNAFEAAGNGYHATWPMPLPVIAIDQMWTNDLVDVSQCDVKWTIRSDHRPLVADLQVTR